jgi:hypothetical protein
MDSFDKKRESPSRSDAKKRGKDPACPPLAGSDGEHPEAPSVGRYWMATALMEVEAPARSTTARR